MTDKRASNFIRQAIEEDLRAIEKKNTADSPARIRTRFPPEPNGHLHIGHAKSICLNFGLAQAYGGQCHLRLDDTNPIREDQSYVDAIMDGVKWLGFSWGKNLYHASDYFAALFACAEALIQNDLAYVDDQDVEAIRLNRGSLTEPGKNSPWRNRTASENLDLLHRMRDGEFPNGARVLRLKIDMANANLNLRDPVIYRILHAPHQQSGEAWCIYPMYDFAHGVSDALERITHSLCTMEFEDHRPLYNWLNERLADLGLLARPLPRQIEFARLNLSHTVLSKRKLIQLVQEGHVNGWDDPRMPTLTGLRRRGFTPSAIRHFIETIGVAKENSLISQDVLEESQRQDLDPIARRAMVVMAPLHLELTNWSEGKIEECEAALHPKNTEMGKRLLPFGRHLWIEEEDFCENPPKGYRRFSVGAVVRLRHAYVVRCTGFEKDQQGRVTKVLAEVMPDSRSGTPGADNYKPQGNIHWLCQQAAFKARVKIIRRLFLTERPGENFIAELNPNALEEHEAYLEPSLATLPLGTAAQFERHGYFSHDEKETHPHAPVFIRSVELKSSWKPSR